ncbi:MAG: AAA family ATPase [bacterium]
MNTLFFLNGACGTGKTTVAKALAKLDVPNLNIHHFDSIGVPKEKEILEKYGNGENWQRLKTAEWVKKVQPELLEHNVILDIQTRPLFIEEACHNLNIKSYEIILFHCTKGTRKNRLETRQQPDLANEKMEDWSQYLKKEHESRRCIIIDNSYLSVDETTSILREIIINERKK